MPESFDTLPGEERRDNSYDTWANVVQSASRNNFDSPTSIIQGGEFWLESSGENAKRDIEKIQLAEMYANFAQWQMYAPCNLRSLYIEQAEAFISVASMMLQARQDYQKALASAGDEFEPDDDDDDYAADPDDPDAPPDSADDDEDESEEERGMAFEDDVSDADTLPGVIYRQRYAHLLDLENSPEHAQAFQELPYAIATDIDARHLATAVGDKKQWLIEQRKASDVAKANGYFRDYGYLIKMYRQSDPERALGGAKSVNTPFFFRRLQAMVDSSAAGALRQVNMALVARLMANIAGGGAPSVSEQRKMQRRPSGSGRGSGEETE